MNALYAECLQKLSAELQSLPDKSEESADATLRALWVKAQGEVKSVLAAQNVELKELNEAQTILLKAAIDDRLLGVPLAHITQRQAFMGLELKSTEAALIPRKETEILANLVLDYACQLDSQQPLILDICTGCGNIALTVFKRIQSAKVYGADISADAIALANENAKLLACGDGVKFFVGDLLEPFRSDDFIGKVDILICNPPYILSANVEKMPIEISQYEPKLAFDGGALGIGIIDKVIRQAPEFLKDKAWLCMEIGAGQGPFVEKRINKSGLYDEVKLAKDSDGVIRAISARKKTV